MPLFHLEHYIEGKYIKYNSNSGFVRDDMRLTPQVRPLGPRGRGHPPEALKPVERPFTPCQSCQPLRSLPSETGPLSLSFPLNNASVQRGSPAPRAELPCPSLGVVAGLCPHSPQLSHHPFLPVSPQAFSHFTFERSGHQLIVVDIQGVGDLYTDPQIHTEKGTDFGDGNLGRWGKPARFHGDLTPFKSPSSLYTQEKQAKSACGLCQGGGGGTWACDAPTSAWSCPPRHKAEPRRQHRCSVRRCPGHGALLLLPRLQPHLQEHGPRALRPLAQRAGCREPEHQTAGGCPV